MFSFGKRVIEPELLDHADPEDARANLADLVRLNRRLGGHSTIRKLLAKVARRDEAFSLLDVGAASGDTAELIRMEYPNARVTSFDCNAVNLAMAPAPKLLGDAFHMPFGESSFDYVFSSLFLHHFADEVVVGLLRDFRTIARRAVLIADLERHVASYWFLAVTQPLFRWHWISVHDGQRSVQAAFSAGELRQLAQKAGMGNPDVEVHRPAFRLTLVGKKR